MIIMYDNGKLEVKGFASDIVAQSQAILLNTVSLLNEDDKKDALIYIKETGYLLSEITKNIQEGYRGEELVNRSIANVNKKINEGILH